MANRPTYPGSIRRCSAPADGIEKHRGRSLPADGPASDSSPRRDSVLRTGFPGRGESTRLVAASGPRPVRGSPRRTRHRPGHIARRDRVGQRLRRKRIYTPEANPDTTGGPPNTYNLFGGGTATGGSWAALNPQTGAFDWQTAVPGSYAALGPVSEANGVLYGASWTPAPRIRTCSRWTRAPARSCGARPGHR